MKVRLESTADREASVEVEGLASSPIEPAIVERVQDQEGAFAPLEEGFRVAVLGDPAPALDGRATGTRPSPTSVEAVTDRG